MKSIFCHVILVMFIAFGSFYVRSQESREPDLKQVKTLIRDGVSGHKKATILFRSLVASEGRLEKFDSDSFYVKRGRKYFRSFYKDVLEISTSGKTVSLVPDPITRPYGSWSGIGQVFAGTKILVVLNDGRSVKGFSNSATDTHLVMIDNKTDARLDLPKERVAAFIALLGGFRGAKQGAAKGSEGLLQPGGDAILGGAGAGIGALLGALMKSDGRPILIYSR